MGLPPVPTDHMPIARPGGAVMRHDISAFMNQLPGAVEAGFDQMASVRYEHSFPTWVVLLWNGRFIEHVSGRLRPDVTRHEVTLGTPGVVLVKDAEGRDTLDFGGWAKNRWHLKQVRVDDLIHPDGERVGVPPLEVYQRVALIDWCETRLCHPEIFAQIAMRSWDLRGEYWSTEPTPRFLQLRDDPRFKTSNVDDAIDRLRVAKGTWRDALETARTGKVAIPRLNGAVPELTPRQQVEASLAGLPEAERAALVAQLMRAYAPPAAALEPVEAVPVAEDLPADDLAPPAEVSSQQPEKPRRGRPAKSREVQAVSAAPTDSAVP